MISILIVDKFKELVLGCQDQRSSCSVSMFKQVTESSVRSSMMSVRKDGNDTDKLKVEHTPWSIVVRTLIKKVKNTHG